MRAGRKHKSEVLMLQQLRFFFFQDKISQSSCLSAIVRFVPQCQVFCCSSEMLRVESRAQASGKCSSTTKLTLHQNHQQTHSSCRLSVLLWKSLHSTHTHTHTPALHTQLSSRWVLLWFTPNVSRFKATQYNHHLQAWGQTGLSLGKQNESQTLAPAVT